MPHDTEVNLGPGDVVLDGVPAPPRLKGTQPLVPPPAKGAQQPLPSLRPMSIVTEGAIYIRQGGHHVGHWPTF